MQRKRLALALCSILAPFLPAYAAQALHRVDMQIKGSSCASCLTRLEKKLRQEKGVLKVMVSVYRPFNSVVIYDSKKTNWQNINQVLQSEKVTAEHFSDSSVTEIPLVLQPK